MKSRPPYAYTTFIHTARATGRDEPRVVLRREAQRAWDRGGYLVGLDVRARP